MKDIKEIKNNFKYRHINALANKRTSNNHSKLFNFLNRLLITSLLFLVASICIKSSYNSKMFIYKHIYDTNLKFANFNSIYKKYFGNIIPLDSVIKKTEPVFNENLTYSSFNKYKDGVKLKVDDNYLVPSIESGIVVFIGNKEGYGNTVIIQQVNGIDIWYSNFSNVNIKMYDYIEKGSLIGEVNKELILIFQKEGKVLDYKEYIK
jgi:stage IV sporulation protein FA